MISVRGYYENGVCIPTETLDIENRQQVIITVVDEAEPLHQNKEEAIAELRSLCHPGKHIWKEAPDDYIKRMRDDERF